VEEKSRAFSQHKSVKPYAKGNHLFDIGAGEGFVLEFFEKKDFQVYGIESTPKACKIINKKLNTGKCDVGNIENFSLPHQKFDVIIMSHILEHLLDCSKVLLNLKQILTDVGILLIEVPNCSNTKSIHGSINDAPHVHHFTKKKV